MSSSVSISQRLIVVIACVLFFSCETVVDMDLPPHKPAITLNCLFHSDSSFRVYLTENRFILDGSFEPKTLSGASLTLYGDNQLIGSLQEQSPGVYEINEYPEPGIAYRITADKEGYDQVRADDAIPTRFPAVEIVQVDALEQSEFTYNTHQLTYTLNDPEGGDFYEVRLYKYMAQDELREDEDTSYTSSAGYFLQIWYQDAGTASDNIEFTQTSFLFSDEGFDGQSKEIKIQFNNEGYNMGNISIYTENSQSDTSHLLLDVRQVSESYFRYQTSRQAQSYAGDDIFAEPVPVYNNIQNGYGIFAGYHKKQFPFQIIRED